MNPALPAPGPAQVFAQILDALRALLAARMSRPKTAQQLAAIPLMLLLWHRLGRTKTRFAALAARVAAGPLRLRPRPSRPQTSSPADRPARLPDPLPRGFAWLIRLMGYEAAAYGSQLNYLLSQPEMVAFLEAAPQAGRLLRPLCRMLAQPGPPRPKRPKPAASPQPPPAPAAEAPMGSPPPGTSLGASGDAPDREPYAVETPWGPPENAVAPA